MVTETETLGLIIAIDTKPSETRKHIHPKVWVGDTTDCPP